MRAAYLVLLAAVCFSTPALAQKKKQRTADESAAGAGASADDADSEQRPAKTKKRKKKRSTADAEAIAEEQPATELNASEEIASEEAADFDDEATPKKKKKKRKKKKKKRRSRTAGDSDATGIQLASDSGQASDASAEQALSDRRPPALELALGLGVFSRSFEYTDDLFASLRNYELGAAPFVFIDVAWYPLAHDAEASDLANFGLIGRYERGFPPESVTRSGRQFDTSSQAFFIGIRGRMPIETHELGLSAAYGHQSFEVVGDEAAPLMPDVGYEFVDIAADARFRFDEVIAGVRLAKSFVLASGALEEDAWFPRSNADAVSARIYAGYAITPSLDLVIGGDFRRYFFAMNPQPGDPRVAGGAVDQYLFGWGAVVWRLPAAKKDGPANEPENGD